MVSQPSEVPIAYVFQVKLLLGPLEQLLSWLHGTWLPDNHHNATNANTTPYANNTTNAVNTDTSIL